jgi:hypothetical protein
VVVNLTGTDATAGTYLDVWPSGGKRSPTSSLNLAPGTSRANLVLARIGEDGSIAIGNDVAPTHAVVDIVGWYGDRPST